jgi:hypothetical protein
MTQKGLKEKELASRLVYFGVNGVNAFQGLRFIIIIQIQHGYIPFVIGVHYGSLIKLGNTNLFKFTFGFSH